MRRLSCFAEESEEWAVSAADKQFAALPPSAYGVFLSASFSLSAAASPQSFQPSPNSSPAFEGLGIGKTLLERVMAELRAQGHQRLFLGCSSDPASRSYGFYRYLGWTATGETDKYGDDVLEFRFTA
ncbi:Acetyltransferase (GNAT) family protein [Janthinobacterium sp. OK676]|uniref:GNAT family N-acetyltransferase n=1 Tax=Janthinobacterium sp. OK676 TaxID=1855295 RepID=UPI00088AED4B|nr:GNAT family N-acetyltransferase [Janthinobacterium sp. OK676]SDN93450.1 Acetyltransferase (GNAT) family protein [Janthinobacterium sp. OK676]